MADHSVIDAVELLDPRPRQKRWASLSYCVLDAVWSIGALYDPVVVPLIYRVAAANGDSEPMVSSAEQLTVDPLPLPRLLERYVEASGLQQITNRQRTSSRGGIRRQKPRCAMPVFLPITMSLTLGKLNRCCSKRRDWRNSTQL